MDIRILKWFSCPSSFFRKENNKEKGREDIKDVYQNENNMDPDHVISGTGITGSNRESIYYLLHLRCGITLLYLYYSIRR